MSKPITVMATMQLIERGRLALDDTVGDWQPELLAEMRAITVGQLRSHRTGIRHDPLRRTTVPPTLVGTTASFVRRHL